MSASTTPSPSVWRTLLSNVGWALGSLLLALVVWYSATAAQNPITERRFPGRLPIKVLLAQDQSMMVIKQDMTTAQVTIRAPESVWNTLEADSITVTADLTNQAPGSHTITLDAKLPDNVHGIITEIEPPQIIIETARQSEAKFNITVKPTADPPVGYKAGTMTTDQPTALVTGPEDIVKHVVGVQARLSLQDLRNHVSRVVALVAIDAQGQPVSGLTISPETVVVDVDIRTRPDVTLLAIVPKLTGDPPTGYLRPGYSLDPDSVLVRGDQATIDGMNGYISTEPVDLTGKTDSFSQHVKLALPTGVTAIEPVDVTVTVNIVPVQGSREFQNIPIQKRGLDSADFSIAIQPDHVTVIVSGPQPVLDKLTDNDITVIAPLDGLGSGKYQITLQGSVTQTGVTVSLPNSKVDVTITALNPTATPTPVLTLLPAPPGTSSP
jgi:YbbR domain-containing protein